MVKLYHTKSRIILVLLLCINPCISGLRLITNHRRRPLLVAESAREEEEEEEEEEESESYEMASMVEPRRFGKGWRWTTEV